MNIINKINKLSLTKNKLFNNLRYFSTCPPTGCGSNLCSVNNNNNQSDRLHSTDIAHKPSASGWGYNSKYATNYDNIFKKKNSEQNEINNNNNNNTEIKN